MTCRGVRGATTVRTNSRDQILEEARKLLALMIRFNGIESEDVASAVYTVAKDLNAEFPALAARQLGWLDVPLLCSYELDVPGSLARCIRILVHWNTDKRQSEIVHVYSQGAQRLRPDLSKLPPVDFGELEAWIAQHVDECRAASAAGPLKTDEAQANSLNATFERLFPAGRKPATGCSPRNGSSTRKF